MAPKRTPKASRPKPKASGGNALAPVVWRDPATGRFVKRPKEPLVRRPLVSERLTGAPVVQVTRERVMYRDPATGRFTKRPAAPREVVIGKGKRAKVLRPTTEAERVKPIKTDEAERLDATAASVSRVVEDNAATGRETWVKANGAFYRVGPSAAGGLAQLVRLLNARYLQAFSGVLPSPWLRYGLTEMQGGDVLDLDAPSLLPPGLVGMMTGNTKAEKAAASFMDAQRRLLDTYISARKATKRNPRKKRK